MKRQNYYFFFFTCLLTFSSSGQYVVRMDSGSTFYDLVKTNYNDSIFSADSSEGSHTKQLERMIQIWGPRLANSNGDATEASIEIQNLNSTVINQNNTYSWEFIGPTDDRPIQSAFENDTGYAGISAHLSKKTGVGQLHRIAFHPNYGIGNNKTVYAGSFFGGLWKSIDGGDNWFVCGTDYELPISSVSGIAISNQNTERITISTGEGDERLTAPLGSNMGIANPIFTCGIFQSQNGGISWDSKNGNLFSTYYGSGGNIREIRQDPIDDDILYFVGSEGFFRTTNLNNTSPTWSSPQLTNDNQLRGLEIHPTDANTIYASGNDIYRSTSKGSNGSWNSLTVLYSGLDLSSLPRNFETVRINIAVSPSKPDWLWAFLIGEEDLVLTDQSVVRRLCCYIYRLDDESGSFAWEELDYYYSLMEDPNNLNSLLENNRQILSTPWMGFCVSPNNEDLVYYGGATLRGVDGQGNFDFVSSYNTLDFHADVHYLAFEPNLSNPKLFCANHGGIGTCHENSIGAYNWTKNNSGLGNSLIWSFDTYPGSQEIITGHQDNGVIYFGKGKLENSASIFNPIVDNTYSWRDLHGADGYTTRILQQDPKHWLLTDQHKNLSQLYYSPETTTYNKRYYGLKAFLPIRPMSTSCLREKSAGIFPIAYSQTETFIPYGSEVYRVKKPFRISNNDPNTPDDYWFQTSDQNDDLLSNLPKYYGRGISEMAISTLNSSVKWIAVGGQLIDGILVTPKLFVSGSQNCDYALPSSSNCSSYPSNLSTNSNGIIDPYSGDVDCYSEISMPFNPVNAPLPISGLSCSSVNQDEVYVSFSSYNQSIKVYKYNKITGQWTDVYSTTLPNTPINGIEVQEGTNDRVFIATDIGVFYLEPGSSQWVRYGKMPNVRVNELKIDHCKNKIVAATYGRGMWQCELPEATPLPDYYITQGTTFNPQNEFYRRQNYILEKGSQMVIDDKLRMAGNAKIIVKPGAELIINGGVISCDCEVLWRGIEVWGKKTLPQTPISNQGYVKVINGGTIENAEIGIAATKHLGNGDVDWSKGGGVIYCYEAIFINNRKDIEFLPYHDLSIRPEPANLSVFYKATFTTNDFAYFKPNEEKGHVTMLNVNGVEFQGCKFKNERTEYEYSNAGIISYKSGYRVTDYCNSYSPNGCEEYTDRTLFKGLGCGVRSMDVANGTRYSAFVDHAIFDYNVHGVYLGAVDFPWITRNEFYTHGRDIEVVNEKPSAFPYAIYLDHCSSYEIQENDMWADWPVVGNVQNSFGIVVTNSALKNEMVYNNYIDGYKIGIEAIGGNRVNFGSQGLEIKCNDFVDLKYDIYVGNHPGIPSVDVGIRTEQGNPPSNPSGPGPELAGNRFSHSNNDSLGIEFDDYINGSPPLINYHHHSGNSQSRVIPGNEDSDDILNLTPIPHPNDYDLAESCPHNIETGSAGEDQAKALEMTNAAFQLAIKENTLSLLEDGGNTPLLESEVDQVTLNTSYQLYADLMLKSPHLSDEIIYELIGKESQFPKALLRDVLVANSQAMNDNGVLEAIDGRWDQLPDYMMHQIMTAAEGGMTAKELLESEISYYSKKYQNALKRRVELRAKDTSGVYNSDSVLVLLEGETNPYFLLLAIEINMSQGDYSAAENLKSTFLSTANIEERDYPIFEELMSFYNDFSFIGKEDSLFYIIDQNEIDNLWNYSTQGISRASIISGSHLERIDENFIYVEPTILPNQTQNRAIYMEVAETTSYLKVYPNPTTDHVFISYRSDYVVGNRTLVLMDVNGKIIMNRELFNTEDEIVIPLKNYASGVYFVTLRIEGEVELSEKLIIE